MDEELLKRNTDCVYFLASPFTCKKGADCEYRHSEMARLNPRDCWYWLSGSCLNPTCGFRHPPVDMHTEAPAEVEPLPNLSSFPPSKNKVPCYFYCNGYCNKGDKCLFLHSPEDTSISKQKNLVDAPPVDDRIPQDSTNHLRPAKLLNDEPHTNISAAKLSARTDPILDAPENFHAATRNTQKVASEDPFPWQRLKDMSSKLVQKESPQRYAYEYEEAFITKSDSNQSDYVIRSEPSICSDQGLDEKVDSGVRDEWWESSPDFDVLVKERTGQFEDADDQEYLLGYEDCYGINNVDHENSYIEHCYDDQKAYGGRFMEEKRMHEPFYYSDDADINDLVHYSDGYRGVNHILSQNRKLINVGLTAGGDLREHLTNQRFLDEHMERNAESFAFRRCNVPFLFKERQEMPQRRDSTYRFHGRLEPDLERKSFSVPMQKSVYFAAKQRRQAWNSQLNNQRRHHRHNSHKRHKFSSNVQRREFSSREVDSEASFTGYSGQSNSVEFEGPKPLSEILKEKKVKSGGEGSNDGSSSA
ncbi:hypothetical protein V2J09_010301 [Rumex salicifolius]